MRVNTKTTFISAVLIATGLLLGAGPASADLDLGKPAPGFTGIDSNGDKVSLGQYRGKTVVLEWTNHDCPFVVRHYGLGNMQAQQKEATGDGVVWLSVISSAPGLQGHVSGKEANELTKSRNAGPTKVILDEKGEIGRKYAAVTTPHMYIVDPKGALVYQGGIDDYKTTSGPIRPGTQHFVRMALADMKAGKPIAKPYSRPYGCTIKYAD